MREILKYSELSERDKKKRYKALFELPSSLVLFTVFWMGFHYTFMMYFVMIFILIELVIFGLLDTKYHYTLSSLLKDTFYLIGTTIITTLFLAPALVSAFTQNMSLSETVMNGLNFGVSMILLYTIWYAIVALQSKVKKQSEKWKWDVTSLFSTDKHKFDEI